MSAPTSPKPETRGARTFFASLGIGLIALVVALLGSDTVAPQASVGMTTFGVVYLLGGLYCGRVFPKYGWTAILGLCAPSLVIFSVFGLLILSGDTIRPDDRSTLSFGAAVTAAAFVAASAGVAVGRRMRPSR
jgi:MFS family permease